ncbi:MAG: diphosphate--fructose-6-phosphate 1-phosphotransferase [Endomicrobium sp.]|nr:diphosphate--fructose-6-phosphate 1-phosphotransferase [Endomicrobium sp.]
MNKKLTCISKLQVERRKFRPVLPDILKKGASFIRLVKGKFMSSAVDQVNLRKIFKNTYGLPEIMFKRGASVDISKKSIKVAVVFSGGQAPGGHNVIAGLFDGLKKANKKNILIGYLGGPSGILENRYKLISKKMLFNYRNTGGFDFIQSGRAKIETPEQFRLIKDNFSASKVDALVIVGGDDSNTNAAMIAEYMEKENLNKCVVGVPKTIDGDLKNDYIEASFGFDTATKIYSELVGNICRDVNSSRKYWHFVRLMGRSASHITLEVGLKTQPNIVLIGEEILESKMTLVQVVEYIVSIIVKRSQDGKNFGVILVPEGLIEFIYEIKELIYNLNDVLVKNAEIVTNEEKKEFVYAKLPKEHFNFMKSLPIEIASQLMLDRDPHGNVRVSLIETEKLLVEMVKKRLLELKKEDKYEWKFSAITHFFGYEGRCGIPSNFDANYTYALGYNSAVLVLNGITGYLSSIRNLVRPPKYWKCGGIPLTMMMNIEKRHGEYNPVIRKALVDLNGKPFKKFVKNRVKWAVNDSYVFPGPVQYFGPLELTDMTTKTLQYERSE